MPYWTRRRGRLGEATCNATAKKGRWEHMKSLRTIVMAVGVVAVAGLSGCRSAPDQVQYARAFPEIGQQREVVDIQVFKRPTKLELVNTTNRAFGASTLWLNQRFSHPIEGLGVGQTLVISLDDFRDEYSEPFRDESFFATEMPDRLVLAQLETADPGDPSKTTLVGLIVIGKDE